jgi:RHS repeat-associated protein
MRLPHVSHDTAGDARGHKRHRKQFVRRCGGRICQARSAGNAPTRSYYTEGEFVPGGPAQPYYCGPDQIGSARRVFASASDAPAYSYDPYGNSLQNTAPLVDFNYAGMFYNSDSGLYLTQYRAYGPLAGRWLSRDPLGEKSDALANLYAYVGGNPVRDIDPKGLAAGDFPPPPPGYDPSTWKYEPLGKQGRHSLVDPEGERWICHPEDAQHWRHWDKDNGDKWPPDPDKPWPTQTRPPYGRQSSTDPSGSAPPWIPPITEFGPYLPWPSTVPSPYPPGSTIFSPRLFPRLVIP